MAGWRNSFCIACAALIWSCGIGLRVGEAVAPVTAFTTIGTDAYATVDTNLTGTVTYDMAKLTPKLRELVGGKFAAVGKGTKPFSFVSPPVSEPSTG